MKLKFISFLILILISKVAMASQHPQWLWGRSAGGTNQDEGLGIATDKQGNVFASGSYTSASIIFGNDTLINVAPGQSDIYIVKYDSSGNVLWAHSTGGSGYDFGYSVSTDDSGNVFLAGSNNSQLFLAKYTSAGSLLWTDTGGGAYGSYYKVAATDSGNVYVCGYFSNTSVVFGVDTFLYAGANHPCIIVVKYSGNGQPIWVKLFGAPSFEYANDLAIDKSGNILMTGFFGNPTITFGTFVLNNATGTSVSTDMFLVKFSPTGNVLWAKRAGGVNDDNGYGVTTDSSENVIITGYFKSPSFTVGGIPIVNHNQGSCDIFIIKYNSAGNVLWAKDIGGIGNDLSSGITADVSGNLYLIGEYQSQNILLGVDTAINIVPGKYDILLLKFDSSGNVKWANQFDGGGLYDDFGAEIVADGNDNIYFTGTLGDFLVFGDSNVVISSGIKNMYVFKFNDSDTITGFAATKNDEKIMIYPNPALNHHLHIDLNKNNLLQYCNIELLDAMGEQLLFSEINEQHSDVDLNSIQKPGIYFLKISDKSGKNLLAKKIIMQ